MVNEEIELLSAVLSADYRSTVLADKAKRREAEAMKKYQKLKKDPFPKLYDKPPHMRHGNT